MYLGQSYLAETWVYLSIYHCMMETEKSDLKNLTFSVRADWSARLILQYCTIYNNENWQKYSKKIAKVSLSIWQTLKNDEIVLPEISKFRPSDEYSPNLITLS